MKQHAGFTILELMITVSVAAILLAIGVPGFQDFIRNNRRAAEVNNLVSTLQIARNESVTRNRRVGVCPTSNGTSCSASTNWETGWIVYVDEGGTEGSRDAGEEILRFADGPEGMTVRVEFKALNYLPNGRIRTYPDANTPGNFTFCDGRGASQARVVQLGISGRPATESTKIDGSAPTCP